MDGDTNKIRWSQTVDENQRRQEYCAKRNSPPASVGDEHSNKKRVLKKGKRDTPKVGDARMPKSRGTRQKAPCHPVSSTSHQSTGQPKPLVNHVKHTRDTSAHQMVSPTKQATAVASPSQARPLVNPVNYSGDSSKASVRNMMNPTKQATAASSTSSEQKQQELLLSGTISTRPPRQRCNGTSSEQAEQLQEERNALHMTPEMHEHRAQLMRIKRRVEAMRVEDVAEKQLVSDRQREPTESEEAVTANEIEEKRLANEEMYQRIFLLHKQKLTELRDKIKWMEMKQESKLQRISNMDPRDLNLEQKMKLRGLKHSSKKLKAKIVQTHAEVSRRRGILKQIRELQKNCLTNPNPMQENPTMADFDPGRFHVEKCWGSTETLDHHPSHTPPRRTERHTTDISIHTAVQMQKEQTKLTQQTERPAKITEVQKREMDSKRQKNAQAYYEIYLSQKNKITELREKLNWMHSKQNSKLNRIKAMKEDQEGHLTFEQKLWLRNLKSSSKKLGSQMAHTEAEISRRWDTIKKLSELQQACLRNPNPMAENPSPLDFEPAPQEEVNTAPPPTPAIRVPADDLVRPLIDPPVNVVPQENPVERPSTRTLAQRIKPKALLKTLKKKLGKKSKNSRPLGAHHNRIRSVTTNVQEEIPYEARQCDSDSDEENTSAAQLSGPNNQESQLIEERVMPVETAPSTSVGENDQLCDLEISAPNTLSPTPVGNRERRRRSHSTRQRRTEEVHEKKEDMVLPLMIENASNSSPVVHTTDQEVLEKDETVELPPMTDNSSPVVEQKDEVPTKKDKLEAKPLKITIRPKFVYQEPQVERTPSEIRVDRWLECTEEELQQMFKEFSALPNTSSCKDLKPKRADESVSKNKTTIKTDVDRLLKADYEELLNTPCTSQTTTKTQSTRTTNQQKNNKVVRFDIKHDTKSEKTTSEENVDKLLEATSDEFMKMVDDINTRCEAAVVARRQQKQIEAKTETKELPTPSQSIVARRQQKQIETVTKTKELPTPSQSIVARRQQKQIETVTKTKELPTPSQSAPTSHPVRPKRRDPSLRTDYSRDYGIRPYRPRQH